MKTYAAMGLAVVLLAGCMAPDYVCNQKESVLYILYAVERMTQEGRLAEAEEVLRKALPRVAEEDVPLLLSKIEQVRVLAPIIGGFEAPIELRNGRFVSVRDGAEMVYVPMTGLAQLGWIAPPWTLPHRRAYISAFFVDKHEVTNRQYRAFLKFVLENSDAPFRHPQQTGETDHAPVLGQDGESALPADYFSNPKYDDLPVVGITWFDAYAYASWAGKRLPTEAEWEKAARGEESRQGEGGPYFPWGNSYEGGFANVFFAQYGEDGKCVFETDPDSMPSRPSRPGSFPKDSSVYGALDMAGNVSEFCMDDFHRYFSPRDPQTLVVRVDGRFFRHSFVPRGARVVRGGSFKVSRLSALGMYPVMGRWGVMPWSRLDCVGFRCAVSIPETPATKPLIDAAVESVKSRWQVPGDGEGDGDGGSR